MGVTNDVESWLLAQVGILAGLRMDRGEQHQAGKSKSTGW